MTQPEYEQKKRECWEEFWDEISGNIDFTPGVPDRIQEHIYATFDRAYALGQQEPKEFEITDLTDQLLRLRKDVLNHIVYGLMLRGKITYHEIMDMYIEYLKELEQGKSDKLTDLRNKVIEMWTGKDADYGKNLKEIMHYLVDKRMINYTHEEIDAK